MKNSTNKDHIKGHYFITSLFPGISKASVKVILNRLIQIINNEKYGCYIWSVVIDNRKFEFIYIYIPGD